MRSHSRFVGVGAELNFGHVQSELALGPLNGDRSLQSSTWENLKLGKVGDS